MKSGNQFFSWIFYRLAGCLFLSVIFFAGDLSAGNREHVENRVEDLEIMNKEVIEGLSGVPKYGTIEYKAQVIERKTGSRINVIEKKIEIIPEPVKDNPPEKKNKKVRAEPWDD